jgi:HAD superfamily hydrolase (TIGR01509 family)
MTTSIEAVIFDMDGVLLDGEPLHFAASRSLLGEFGHELHLATYQRWIGQTFATIWPDLQRRFALRVSAEEYAHRYSTRVLAQYAAHSAPLPGARELLEGLEEARMPCALASSSRREWVEAALGTLGFAPFFCETVTGDEVSAGKPDPEIYRTAAERLGVAPGRCLVIEDAPVGIASARAAGMSVVAVRTEMTAGLALDGAARIIDSLTEFELAWLGTGGRQEA